MAQGYDYKQVVPEIEAGANTLTFRLLRPKCLEVAAAQAVSKYKGSYEESDESDDFIGGQGGFPDEFDGAVREYPKGEAGQGEADCLQLGERGFHRG